MGPAELGPKLALARSRLELGPGQGLVLGPGQARLEAGLVPVRVRVSVWVQRLRARVAVRVSVLVHWLRPRSAAK
jgi:hypothetical protein